MKATFMGVQVVYIDLRNGRTDFYRFDLNWRKALTAKEVLLETLGDAEAEHLEDGLRENDAGLTISWTNHSLLEDENEIGEVDHLDWTIPDNSTLIVNLEDWETSEDQENAAIEWMAENL